MGGVGLLSLRGITHQRTKPIRRTISNKNPNRQRMPFEVGTEQLESLRMYQRLVAKSILGSL